MRILRGSWGARCIVRQCCRHRRLRWSLRWVKWRKRFYWPASASLLHDWNNSGTALRTGIWAQPSAPYLREVERADGTAQLDLNGALEDSHRGAAHAGHQLFSALRHFHFDMAG